MSDQQTLTREEFLEQYEQRHPRPSKHAVAALELPAEPRPQSATWTWRFWAIVTPIAMLVIVSVFRVNGAFFDVAKKGQYIFVREFETAHIEGIMAALAFDLAIVGLMAERVQRQRRSKPQGRIGAGLALALFVTGLTNLQQGLQTYAVGVQTVWDALQLGAALVFVFALSAGVPILAAFLSNVIGGLLADIDEENRAALDTHKADVARLQDEHRARVEQAEREFAEATAKWQQSAEGQWTRVQRQAAREQTAERTVSVREHTERTQRTLEPIAERTNGHLQDEWIVRLFTEQPGCSLREGAIWLGEQYKIETDSNKLYRKAESLIDHGLRKDGGKYFVEHNVGASDVPADPAPLELSQAG